MTLRKQTAAALMCLALFGPTVYSAEASAVAAVLTPNEVMGWMAPLRIENGRLGLDWSAIGLIAARHAGLQTLDGKTTAAINTDVKFVVSVGPAGSANAPEIQLVLHADGVSLPSKTRDDTARELLLSVRIAERVEKGGLRGDLSVQGRPSLDGQSYDASDMKLNLDSPTCLVLYSVNRKTRDFRMKFKEERILKLDLSISHSGNILILRFENTDNGTGFDFTQKPNGEAELSYSQGEAKKLVRAAGFRELVQKYAGELQSNFFRPLSDVGIQFALSPDLPVVMAAASTGFSDPLPEISKKADELIQAVTHAATPTDRARAVTDLTRFFPQAIFRITQAAEKEPDATAKAALQKAIAAHPGIARALPYVQVNKLQDDRDYLFDMFEHVYLLKDAARARLAILEGKDYGDNPESWRKK